MCPSFGSTRLLASLASFAFWIFLDGCGQHFLEARCFDCFFVSAKPREVHRFRFHNCLLYPSEIIGTRHRGGNGREVTLLEYYLRQLGMASGARPFLSESWPVSGGRIRAGVEGVKINGWQRIGIVASVVWIVGSGLYTYESEIEGTAQLRVNTYDICMISAQGGIGTPDGQPNRLTNQCDKKATDAVSGIRPRQSAALFAFIPVLLAWGFTYLVLFLLRWVKRGFVPSRLT